MNVSSLLSLFGDIPKDSATGEALKGFVGALFVDARQGGTVGNAFRAVIDAGVRGDDPLYAQVTPMDRAMALNTLNALKGALDA